MAQYICGTPIREERPVAFEGLDGRAFLPEVERVAPKLARTIFHENWDDLSSSQQTDVRAYAVELLQTAGLPNFQQGADAELRDWWSHPSFDLSIPIADELSVALRSCGVQPPRAGEMLGALRDLGYVVERRMKANEDRFPFHPTIYNHDE